MFGKAGVLHLSAYNSLVIRGKVRGANDEDTKINLHGATVVIKTTGELSASLKVNQGAKIYNYGVFNVKEDNFSNVENGVDVYNYSKMSWPYAYHNVSMAGRLHLYETAMINAPKGMQIGAYGSLILHDRTEISISILQLESTASEVVTPIGEHSRLLLETLVYKPNSESVLANVHVQGLVLDYRQSPTATFVLNDDYTFEDVVNEVEINFDGLPRNEAFFTYTVSGVQFGLKSYELSNHLGNVLTVVSDYRNGLDATILKTQDYYAFGSEMEGRGFDGAGYRYGFQGQEEDKESGFVNYKYRMHDPRLGRFFAVDPLFMDFPWNSGYAFSENRVIDAFELEGLESIIEEKRLIDGEIVIKLFHHNNPEHKFKFYDVSNQIHKQATIEGKYYYAWDNDSWDLWSYLSGYDKDNSRPAWNNHGVLTVDYTTLDDVPALTYDDHAKYIWLPDGGWSPPSFEIDVTVEEVLFEMINPEDLKEKLVATEAVAQLSICTATSDVSLDLRKLTFESETEAEESMVRICPWLIPGVHEYKNLTKKDGEVTETTGFTEYFYGQQVQKPLNPQPGSVATSFSYIFFSHSHPIELTDMGDYQFTLDVKVGAKKELKYTKVTSTRKTQVPQE